MFDDRMASDDIWNNVFNMPRDVAILTFIVIYIYKKIVRSYL